MEKTNHDLVYEYLVSEPRFRERSSKNRGIADLLIVKYNLNIDRWTLADVLKDATNMDRAWRRLLEDESNKHLRGNDYYQKDEIEQEYQLDIGYMPGYGNDIKKLKSLK